MNHARFTLLLSVAVVFLLAIVSPAIAGQAGKQKPLSIDQLRTLETSIALHDRANQMIAGLENDLKEAKAADDKDAEDDIEDTLEMLEFAGKRLSDAVKSSKSAATRFEINSYADRILQTIEEPVVGEFLPGVPDLFLNVVVGGLIGQPLQGLSPQQQHKPLGKSKAAKESAYLFEKGRDSFFSVDELAAMTPEEVSELDVSPDNPTWFDHDSFAGLRPDPVAHFENLIGQGTTDFLHKKDDLKKDARYDIDAARKVLFLDKIYHSGTGPKGRASDAFGVDWKLKWGPEASIEPVTWQLYLLAGAKMTDFTATSGFGPSDMILILMDAEDAAGEDEKEDELFPATIDEFKAALKTFYGFDMSAYIHSHGVVTEGNVDSLLRNLPKGGKKKYKKDEIIGREWIAFRESCVELRMKGFVRRHDGSRLSDVVAVNDRATRGCYLFDMWVGNRDVKDDNNKAYFMKKKDGKKLKITGYREGRHDLGLTLGSFTAAGEINEFGIDQDFARRGLFGKIRFRQSVIFRPESWDSATWADAKWMARHIVSITDGQIRNAVTASDWPDFAREALIYRLINRRNQIAKLFDLATEPGLLGAEPPSMTVALGTPEEIAAAERKYGLPRGSLASELAAAGKGPGYTETVLHNGEITSGLRSNLVSILVRYRYPSGLASRYQTMSHTPPACRAP